MEDSPVFPKLKVSILRPIAKGAAILDSIFGRLYEIAHSA